MPVERAEPIALDPARWQTVPYRRGLVPICLGCHRRTFGFHVDLGPPDPAWREEKCGVCGYRTNHGLYLEER